MDDLRFTLIGDGSSDKVLLNIIKWTLNDLFPKLPTIGIFADFRSFQTPPKTGEVHQRVCLSEEYFPFDVLFYHRDAEQISHRIIDQRRTEVLDELQDIQALKTVCVIPITMMESWLFINEDAIKKASGNRNYKGTLNIPSLNQVESIKAPKYLLHDLLKQASGLKGRGLKKFNVHSAVHLISENIQDYSSLRELYSFQRFEEELKIVVERFLSSKSS